jgi:hypothetical protein
MNKPWFKNSETTNNTKFWGLTLDNILNWKMHIDLTLSKLNKAFYTIETYSDAGLPSQDLVCLLSFIIELWYHLLGEL